MTNPRAVTQPSSAQRPQITVEYRRPSVNQIREYGALLDQANLHKSSNNMPPSAPPKRAPLLGPSSFKPKDLPSPLTIPHITRNSLQRPPPRNRKLSTQIDTVRTDHTLDPPIPTNTSFNPTKSSYSQNKYSSPYVIPPPQPSRDDTVTLDDILPTRLTFARRRISSNTSVIGSVDSLSAGDPVPYTEEVHSDSSWRVLSPPTPQLPSFFTKNGAGATSTRGATVIKEKKGMLGFMSNLLGSNKRVEISAPFDPIRLTHVGFDTSTGEYTGLPKEWQQHLQESGASREEREKNQEAVMEIIKFYREARDKGVLTEMGGVLKDGPPVLPPPPLTEPLISESFHAPRPAPHPPKRLPALPQSEPPTEDSFYTPRFREEERKWGPGGMERERWRRRDFGRERERRLRIPSSVSSLTVSSSATSFSRPPTPCSSLGEHLTLNNIHGALVTSVAESACEHLIRHTFSPRELPSLIDEVLSDKDGTGTIHRLTAGDAQALIDVIDKILDAPDLLPWTRKKCLRLLYRTCGYHARLPSALAVPIWYDRTGNALYRGGYADVWKGKYRGQDVAVKVIRTYSTDELENVINAFCKEAVAWRFLRHPNVLQLIGVLMSEDRFAMASKWMVNGNINQYIKAHPEANRFRLLEGVAEGLIYLHDNEMVHGDLKGVNILIDEAGHPRLADFGLLTIISDPANLFFSSSYSQGGTVRWMGPELIDPERFGFEKSRRTISSDCYALGMVIYETISGNIPFHQHTDLMVSLKVIAGEHPAREAAFPRRVWKMLERCWVFHPDGRPNIVEVLQSLRKVA